MLVRGTCPIRQYNLLILSSSTSYSLAVQEACQQKEDHVYFYGTSSRKSINIPNQFSPQHYTHRRAEEKAAQQTAYLNQRREQRRPQPARFSALITWPLSDGDDERARPLRTLAVGRVVPIDAGLRRATRTPRQ